MRLGPLLSLLVEPLDVRLELVAVDAPHASSTELDRGKVTRSDERVDLRNAHVQKRGDVVQREKTGLDLWIAHALRIAPETHFPWISSRLRMFESRRMK